MASVFLSAKEFVFAVLWTSDFMSSVGEVCFFVVDRAVNLYARRFGKLLIYYSCF